MSAQMDGGPSQEGLDHAAALIEDVISVCYATSTALAIDQGTKAAFQSSEIDVRRELESLWRRLQMTNPRSDIDFFLKEDDTFPRLWQMDRDVFTSVMYTLIHNALKYGDIGSRIDLECTFERNVDRPALKVKSFGAEIDPSEREQIFEKFFRGRSVREKGRLHHGTGVGLWAARRLMRAIGGDLSVELSPNHPRLSIFIVWPPHRPGVQKVEGL